MVSVFQKEPAGNRTVCYCSDVTEGDLRRAIDQAGTSTAADTVVGGRIVHEPTRTAADQ